tara:strand:+ start:226 stop:2937 length:2712 start_codon:yes stop_codon:yes gene_type:complete
MALSQVSHASPTQQLPSKLNEVAGPLRRTQSCSTLPSTRLGALQRSMGETDNLSNSSKQPTLENISTQSNRSSFTTNAQKSNFSYAIDKSHEDKFADLNQVNKAKVGAYVVLDKNGKVTQRVKVEDLLGTAALFKRRLRKAIGISSYLNPENAVFKLDGPDDTAYLVKEPVEGIGQSLAHMGVLWVFTPFVLMAKRGLKDAYKATVDEMKEIKKNIDDDLFSLQGFQEKLGQKLPQLDLSKKITLEQARKNVAKIQWQIDCVKGYGNSQNLPINKENEARLKQIHEQLNQKSVQNHNLQEENERSTAVIHDKLQGFEAHKSILQSEISDFYSYKDMMPEVFFNDDLDVYTGKLNDLNQKIELCHKELNQLNKEYNLEKETIESEANSLKNDLESIKNRVDLDESFELKDLNDCLDTANSLVSNIEKFNKIKHEKPEAFAAYMGMSGMFKAMVLFFVGATGSIFPHLSDNVASQVIGKIGSVIGDIGTGVMAVAQLSMMISGVSKVYSGFKDVQNLRDKLKTVNAELNRLEQLNNKADFEPQITALKDMRANLPREIKWKFLEKAVPGSSLTIGQGLMLAWSAISVAGILSGVGAPAGFGLMVPLLALGVGFTLASAMPKFGFEAIFEDQVDKRFGMHVEEKGFDKLDYRKEMRELGIKNSQEISTFINNKTALLTALEKDDNKKGSNNIASIDNTQGHINSDFLSLLSKPLDDVDFKDLYNLLEKHDGLEEFSESIAHDKDIKKLDVFEEFKVIDVKKIESLSFMHVFEPWKLRKTALNTYNIRKGQEKLYDDKALRDSIFANVETYNDLISNDKQKKPMAISDMRVTSKKLQVLSKEKLLSAIDNNFTNDAAVATLKEAAHEILKDFAVKRLRSEVNAANESLMFALDVEKMNESRPMLESV